MKANESMRKVFSILLCLCMVLTLVPTTAFAVTAAEDGLCGHHTEHTAECGYVAAVAGADCTHTHDAACGYVEAVAEVLCGCTETDESGATLHTEGCGYVAPVAGSDCTHSHDDACGYVAAVEAHECHYECAECAEGAKAPSERGLSAELTGGENPAASESLPQSPAATAPSSEGASGAEEVCDCGTDDAAIHATTCAVYVAPENPKCFCAEKCTETNIWCDVCGVDYTACGGTDTAVPYIDDGKENGLIIEEGETLTITADTMVYNVGGDIVVNGGSIYITDAVSEPMDSNGLYNYVINSGTVIGTGYYSNFNLPTFIGGMKVFINGGYINIPEIYGEEAVTINGDALVIVDQFSIGTEENASPEHIKGVVFADGVGTVKGDVTLPEDLTVKSGESINFVDGATITNLARLTVEEGATILIDGNEHTHNTDGAVTYEKLDDTVHTVLTVCEGCPVGYIGEATENHSTTAEGDRAATCKELAYCSVCQSEYGELAVHTPAEDATYTDNGDGTHSFECSVCGKTGSEAHDYKSGTPAGTCVCGAVCPHSTFTDGVCADCGIPGGYCGGEGDGTNLMWTLKDGKLTITGTGAMADYARSTDSPWYAYCNSITDLSIPEGVTTIGKYAFQGCKLRQVTIPASVTSMDAPSAFSSYDMESIRVESGSTTYKDIDGVLYTADGKTLLFYPAGKSAEAFTTPDGVTTIGKLAFYFDLSLKTVTLSEGVTTIGDLAFLYCQTLKEVTIPASVTEIGEDAFTYCAKLTTVNVPCNWDATTYDFGTATLNYADHKWENGICTVCDAVCDHSGGEITYTDKGDGTHSYNCTVCGTGSEDHDHTNGKCVCGVLPTPDYTVPTNLTATYGDTLADVTLPAGFTWQDAKTTSVGNAGSNTFKVTYTPDDTENYKTVSDIEVTIQVAKADPEYTVPTGLTVYVGQTLNDIDLPSGWTWHPDADSDFVFTSDHAGNHYATAIYTPKDTLNYNTIEYVVEFTILLLPIDDATVTVSGTHTYNGSAITPEVTVTLGEKTLTKDTDYTVSYSDNVNAGTATVTITGKGDYTGTVPATFTIEKATPAVTTKPAAVENLEYTGEAQTLINAGSTNGGTLQYKVDNGEWSTNLPTATNAGTYTVSYKVDGGNNYNDVAETSFTVTVAKAQAPVITFPTAQNAINFGEPLKNAKLSFYQNDYGTFDWTEPDGYPDKAGNTSYAVDFTPYDLNNYDWENHQSWIESRDALCKTVSVTVNKVAPSYTAPTPKTGLTYTGSAQALITTGTASGGVMQYSLDDTNYSTTIPTGIGADTYTVYYKVVGDSNHNDTKAASIEVEIAKADPDIGTVSYSGETLYDSTDISTVKLTRTDMTVGGTLVLTDSELTAGEGTYNWKFTPEDTENYNTITGTVKLTVTADVPEKIEASGTLSKSSYAYGDSFAIDGLTVTATYTSGATKDVTKSVTFNETLTVGQTSVELTYQGKTCEVTGITVVKKQLVISGMSWDVPENAVYNNTAYTATLIGDLPEGVTVTKTGDTATNAGDYTAKAVFSLADGYSADNYEIVNGGDLTAQWSIAQKSVTVTAKDQTITYGETISGTEITAAGLVDGHSVTAILTPSTANVTVNGTITARAAVITAGTTDVTDNYNVSYGDPAKLVIEPDTSKIDALTTENVTSANEEDIKAVQAMMASAETDGIDEATAEQWAAITANCEDLLEKIEAVEAENARIADAAADYDLNTVKSSDEAAITALIADIDDQLATSNLTDEEKSELENLKTKCNNLIAKIDGTETLIGQLEKEVEDLDAETVKSTDKAALEQVIADAETLIDSGNVTEAEKEALKQTQEDAKALIKVIDDTAAENKALTDQAATFDEDTVKSTDKTVLEQLAQDIEDLLDTQNLTEDERTALETVLNQVEGMIDTINETAEDSKAATDTIGALDAESVTSDDKADLEQAVETIDELLKSDNLTEEERSALIDAKADAEDLLDVIDAAQDAADTENTEKVEDVTAENVKPEDKEALEDAKADLEKALEDNAGNYTEEEKKAIQDEIQRIEDAIEALENVERVSETIGKLPETVEPDDEAAAEDILDAKEAYDELTDHEKSLVNETTKEKLEDLVAALTDYKITKGNNSKWTKGSSNGLSFTANGPYSKFEGIEVDGKKVYGWYYTAKSGSTIITLKASYLRKLDTGKHTLTVLYTDGETEGTFTIKAASDSPATGDNSDIMLWTGVLCVSTLALAVLLAERKRRKFAK